MLRQKRFRVYILRTLGAHDHHAYAYEKADLQKLPQHLDWTRQASCFVYGMRSKVLHTLSTMDLHLSWHYLAI